MLITKKIKDYAEKRSWMLEVEKENRNLLISEQITQWFLDNIADNRVPQMSLEVIKESTMDEISNMVWEELGEAYDALKRL